MLLIRTVTNILNSFEHYFKAELELNTGVGKTPQKKLLELLAQHPDAAIKQTELRTEDSSGSIGLKAELEAKEEELLELLAQHPNAAIKRTEPPAEDTLADFLGSMALNKAKTEKLKEAKIEKKVKKEKLNTEKPQAISVQNNPDPKRPALLHEYVKDMHEFDSEMVQSGFTWGSFLTLAKDPFMEHAENMVASIGSLANFKALIIFRLRRQILTECENALNKLMEKDAKQAKDGVQFKPAEESRDWSKMKALRDVNKNMDCIDKSLKQHIIAHIKEAEGLLSRARAFQWKDDYRPGPGKTEQLLKIAIDVIEGMYEASSTLDSERMLHPAVGAASRDVLPSNWQAPSPELIALSFDVAYYEQNVTSDARQAHPLAASFINAPLQVAIEWCQGKTYDKEAAQTKRTETVESVKHLHLLLKGKTPTADDAWVSTFTEVHTRHSQFNSAYTLFKQRQVANLERMHGELMIKCPEHVRESHKCTLPKS